jgi:tetratricopeptide (TPR) repeat protein
MYTNIGGLGRTDAELREDARALYTAGQTAFAARRFADALSSFRQAYQTVQNPAVLVAIGATLYNLGRSEEAAAVYRDYLRLDPRGADVAMVRETLREISADTPLRATVPPTTPIQEGAAVPPIPPSVPQAPYDASGVDTLVIVGIAGAGVVGIGIAAWLLSRRRSRPNRRYRRSGQRRAA